MHDKYRIYLETLRANDLERAILDRLQGVVSYESESRAMMAAEATRALMEYAIQRPECRATLIIVDRETGHAVASLPVNFPGA